MLKIEIIIEITINWDNYMLKIEIMNFKINDHQNVSRAFNILHYND